jgi:hypothetical protein
MSIGIQKKEIYWGNGLNLDKEINACVLLLVHL